MSNIFNPLAFQENIEKLGTYAAKTLGDTFNNPDLQKKIKAGFKDDLNAAQQLKRAQNTRDYGLGLESLVDDIGKAQSSFYQGALPGKTLPKVASPAAGAALGYYASSVPAAFAKNPLWNLGIRGLGTAAGAFIGYTGSKNATEDEKKASQLGLGEFGATKPYREALKGDIKQLKANALSNTGGLVKFPLSITDAVGEFGGQFGKDLGNDLEKSKNKFVSEYGKLLKKGSEKGLTDLQIGKQQREQGINKLLNMAYGGGKLDLKKLPVDVLSELSPKFVQSIMTGKGVDQYSIPDEISLAYNTAQTKKGESEIENYFKGKGKTPEEIQKLKEVGMAGKPVASLYQSIITDPTNLIDLPLGGATAGKLKQESKGIKGTLPKPTSISEAIPVSGLDEIADINNNTTKQTKQLPNGVKGELPVPKLTFNYTKNPNLSEQGAELEDKFGRWIQEDVDRAYKEYEKQFGNVLDVDNARELSTDYQLDRSQSPFFHEPASQLIKDLYNQKLKEGTNDFSQSVLFLGGGAGSGKSTALQQFPSLKDEAHLVYDTTMADLESAEQKIQKALDHGKKANLFYVYSDPVKSFEQQLVRAETSGRTVPLDFHVKSHLGAFNTIKTLKQKYKGNPNVSIDVVDNTGKVGQAVKKDLDSITAKGYNFDEETLHGILSRKLEQLKNEGSISGKTYRGTKSDRPLSGQFEQNGNTELRGNEKEGGQSRQDQGSISGSVLNPVQEIDSLVSQGIDLDTPEGLQKAEEMLLASGRYSEDEVYDALINYEKKTQDNVSQDLLEQSETQIKQDTLNQTPDPYNIFGAQEYLNPTEETLLKNLTANRLPGFEPPMQRDFEIPLGYYQKEQNGKDKFVPLLDASGKKMMSKVPFEFSNPLEAEIFPYGADYLDFRRAKDPNFDINNTRLANAQKTTQQINDLYNPVARQLLAEGQDIDKLRTQLSPEGQVQMDKLMENFTKNLYSGQSKEGNSVMTHVPNSVKKNLLTQILEKGGVAGKDAQSQAKFLRSLTPEKLKEFNIKTSSEAYKNLAPLTQRYRTQFRDLLSSEGILPVNKAPQEAQPINDIGKIEEPMSEPQSIQDVKGQQETPDVEQEMDSFTSDFLKENGIEDIESLPKGEVPPEVLNEETNRFMLDSAAPSNLNPKKPKKITAIEIEARLNRGTAIPEEASNITALNKEYGTQIPLTYSVDNGAFYQSRNNTVSVSPDRSLAMTHEQAHEFNSGAFSNDSKLYSQSMEKLEPLFKKYPEFKNEFDRVTKMSSQQKETPLKELHSDWYSHKLDATKDMYPHSRYILENGSPEDLKIIQEVVSDIDKSYTRTKKDPIIPARLKDGLIKDYYKTVEDGVKSGAIYDPEKVYEEHERKIAEMPVNTANNLGNALHRMYQKNMTSEKKSIPARLYNNTRKFIDQILKSDRTPVDKFKYLSRILDKVYESKDKTDSLSFSNLLEEIKSDKYSRGLNEETNKFKINSDNLPYREGKLENKIDLNASKATETPQFKKWFEGSKITDKKGNPLELFHGAKGDFNTFDMTKNPDGVAYFSDKPTVANEYTQTYDESKDNVKKVYLNLKNPKKIDLKGVEYDENVSKEITKAIRDSKREGYDGLIIKNLKDIAEDGKVIKQNQYIAFEPTQIKSATGNRGTFDPNSPNIAELKGNTEQQNRYAEAVAGQTIPEIPFTHYSHNDKLLLSPEDQYKYGDTYISDSPLLNNPLYKKLALTHEGQHGVQNLSGELPTLRYLQDTVATSKDKKLVNLAQQQLDDYSEGYVNTVGYNVSRKKEQQQLINLYQDALKDYGDEIAIPRELGANMSVLKELEPLLRKTGKDIYRDPEMKYILENQPILKNMVDIYLTRKDKKPLGKGNHFLDNIANYEQDVESVATSNLNLDKKSNVRQLASYEGSKIRKFSDLYTGQPQKAALQGNVVPQTNWNEGQGYPLSNKQLTEYLANQDYDQKQIEDLIGSQNFAELKSTTPVQSSIIPKDFRLELTPKDIEAYTSKPNEVVNRNYYHGAAQQIDKFLDAEKAPTSTGRRYGNYNYTTTNPQEAGYYGKNIHEVSVDSDRAMWNMKEFLNDNPSLLKNVNSLLKNEEIKKNPEIQPIVKEFKDSVETASKRGDITKFFKILKETDPKKSAVFKDLLKHFTGLDTRVVHQSSGDWALPFSGSQVKVNKVIDSPNSITQPSYLDQRKIDSYLKRVKRFG